MSRTPATAGLSYTEDKEYDLYVLRGKNCPSENEISYTTLSPYPQPPENQEQISCLNGKIESKIEVRGPRPGPSKPICICDAGFDGADCGSPTCENSKAPKCFGGECQGRVRTLSLQNRIFLFIKTSLKRYFC